MANSSDPHTEDGQDFNQGRVEHPFVELNVVLPESLIQLLQERAALEGRSLASLAAHLLELAARQTP